MKLEEFTERNLIINAYGQIYDEDLNEYRNEEGMMQFLNEDEETIENIFCEQLMNGIGNELVEVEEDE